MAEGRRPVEGKVSSNACSGLSAGFSMSLKQCACGSMVSKPTIAFDLRREPGAGCVRRSWYELASASLARPKPSKQGGSESYGRHGNVGSGA